jgi:cobalt-zinc-cadmium efflux system outer membrane protein
MFRLIAIISTLLMCLGCASNRRAPMTVLGNYGAVAPVPADAASSRLAKAELGLVDLLVVAAEHPRVQAAHYQLRATASDASQRLLYPNPAIGLEAEDVPASGLDVGERGDRLFLTQPLVIGDRLRTARQLGQAETAASAQSAQALLHDLQSRIRKVYVELAYLALREKQLAAVMEKVGAARRLSEERAEAGAVSPAEAQRIQVEHELSSQERESALRRQASVQGRLEALLALDRFALDRFPHDRLKLVLTEPEPPPTWSSLRTALLEHHPQLQRQLQAVSVAEAREEHEKAKRVPDLDVDVAYGRNHANDENFAEFGISLPLPVFDRRQGHIEAARNRAAASRSLVSALERELLAELQASLAQLENRRQALRRYNEYIIPEGNASYAQATRRYRAGKASLLDLLDAQRTQARIKQNRLLVLYELNLAWANIENLTGSPVMHLQIQSNGEETP